MGVRIDRRARPQSRVVVGSLPGQIGWGAGVGSVERAGCGRAVGVERRATHAPIHRVHEPWRLVRVDLGAALAAAHARHVRGARPSDRR